MPSAKAVVKAVQTATTTHEHVSLSGSLAFDTSANTTGEESVIAELQVDLPIRLATDEPIGLAIPAYETFATNGDGAQDTFNVSYDLVNSPATPESLVLFENGNRVTADSVDYAGNSFTYTDAGSGQDLHAFYTVKDQAQLTIRKVSPGDNPDILDTFPVGLANQRNQARDPFKLRGAMGSPLHATVGRDWDIQAVIDAPYPVQFEATSGGSTVSATNAILTLPAWQARTPIDGLSSVLERDAATR